jgi:hypothetical protein
MAWLEPLRIGVDVACALGRVWWCELGREFRYYYLYLKSRGIKKIHGMVGRKNKILLNKFSFLFLFIYILLGSIVACGYLKLTWARVWVLLSDMGDPWVPETHVGTGLGKILHPSWVMGFLMGSFNFYGHASGLCPLPSFNLDSTRPAAIKVPPLRCTKAKR